MGATCSHWRGVHGFSNSLSESHCHGRLETRSLSRQVNLRHHAALSRVVFYLSWLQSLNEAFLTPQRLQLFVPILTHGQQSWLTQNTHSTDVVISDTGQKYSRFRTTMEYYRSIFVTLILTSGVPDPVFNNKKICFPSTAVYHKSYTENISLTEHFEHQQSHFTLIS